MTELILAAMVFTLALLPAVMAWRNLGLFLPPPPATGEPPRVSVLIPARNEAAGIEACVRSALAQQDAEVEVLVLDDQSQDDTAAIVRRMAEADARVRLISGSALPGGWCGKQYACQQLADAARQPYLLFIDADVRLSTDAASRLVAFARQSGAGLVSGFPRQETVTWLEKLLIPLIHVVLLGYLPMDAMRRSASPGFGAGCGQLFLTTRQAYVQAGGHAAVRASLHDGVKLPRAYRRAGLKTDLCDATALASCRMYHGAAATWRGLSKNATEGMASPRAIGPWTLLLLGGHVLPLPLLLGLSFTGGVEAVQSGAWVLALQATLLTFAMRYVIARQFGQSLLGVVLHPLAVLLLLLVQFHALLRQLRGVAPTWRGRSYGVARG